MRLSGYSCLLAFVLGWSVAAEIIYKEQEVNRPLNLPCPWPVEGKATWTRVFPNGSKVNLITADGGGEKRHNDPQRRYSGLADHFRSLHIQRLVLSDSGRYLCNDEAVVDLTVIPSGTNIVNISVNADITLNCSAAVGQSDRPEWSKERAGEQQKISTVGRNLTLKGVQREDSGLYRCDGRPAGYLNVTKRDEGEEDHKATTAQTTLKPPTTTTTTTSSSKPPPPKTNPTSTTATLTTAPEGLVFGIIISFILLPFIIIIIIFCYLRWRRRSKRSEEGNALYEEIQEASYQPSNVGSVEPAGVYNLVTFPAGDSNQNGPTYSTINVLPLTSNRGGTSQPSDSLYSLAGRVSPPGNNEDSSQSTNTTTYYLLEKPKAAGNNSGGPV